MKKTNTPAHVATITASAQTSSILAPLMAAGAQTMKIGDKKPAPSTSTK